MEVFFLFSQHRSGSKLLCSLLDSHPDIACEHESLSPGRGGEKLDYLEVAERLEKENPEAKFIGLHGHYEYLTDQMHLACVPKLLLYRKDEVLGGIKQSLMGIRRANGLFDLHAPTTVYNYQLRIKRNREMKTYSTFKLTYERLTRGKDITKMPWWLNRRILHHIGADFIRLTTSVKKEPEMLPKNLREIYAETSYCA